MSAPAVVTQLDVGLIQNFVTLIRCPTTGAVAVVDPAFEVDRILAAAAKNGGRVTAILITHTHIDHIEGVAECAAATGAPVYVSAREAAALRDAAPAATIVELADGAAIPIGDLAVTARATPGHTPGGITYVGDGFAATGDVLFVGSCGRSDLGGDPRQLYASLMTVLAALPEETRIYPGHDYGPTPTSTLGWELARNPCFQHASPEAFIAWQTIRQSAT